LCRVFVAELLFLATALSVKYGLDYPINEAPPFSIFLRDVLNTNANVLYAVLFLIVTTGIALAGFWVGKRLRVGSL
jgi:hypothetical protein